MSQLIESIRLLDGQFSNLQFHEQRMANALKALYGVEKTTRLDQYLESIAYPGIGLYKCRIIYDSKEMKVEFIPYFPKPIFSLRLVEDDTILYEHKYLDRSSIDKLMGERGDCDDILIVKNGLITDSSYANVAFKRGNSWYTPRQCLLRGTMREFLLSAGQLNVEDIRISDVKRFKKFKLVNAMLGFEGSECDISNIY